MLNENIKILRKSKGLSQEEFAVKLNVVRQTVSKWEQGLSVPDADMLISIAEIFEVPVSTLLGETVDEQKVDDIMMIAEKLEIINLQFSKEKELKRKKHHWCFIILTASIVLVFILLVFSQSPYLHWDYTDPETAIAGTIFHGFEFIFVRIAPFALIGSVSGLFLTRKKDR